MTESTDFKYRAFISYSHKDEKWGKWLHKKLERYKVPKKLQGRNTKAGIVPKRPFPIFRHSEELSTASNLGDMINDALKDSSHLIVICSPNSVQSNWVNEEVKTFKKFGKQDSIICLIVDGEPNANVKDTDLHECFPSSIKVKANEHGDLTEIPAEPIAADIRDNKDGKRKAFLKVVSGLIGVNFDELFQRDNQRKRRRITTHLILSPLYAAIILITPEVAYNIMVNTRVFGLLDDSTRHYNYKKEIKLWLNTTNKLRHIHKEKLKEGYFKDNGFHLASTGAFSFDELRIGRTYDSVLPGNEDDEDNIIYEPFDYKPELKLSSVEGWVPSDAYGVQTDNYIVKKGSLKYEGFRSKGNSIYSPHSSRTSIIRFSFTDYFGYWENRSFFEKFFTITPTEVVEFDENIKNHLFISFIIRPEGVVNQGGHDGFFYFSLETLSSAFGYSIGKSINRDYYQGKVNPKFSTDLFKPEHRWVGDVPGIITPYMTNPLLDYELKVGRSFFVIISVAYTEIEDRE